MTQAVSDPFEPTQELISGFLGASNWPSHEELVEAASYLPDGYVLLRSFAAEVGALSLGVEQTVTSVYTNDGQAIGIDTWGGTVGISALPVDFSGVVEFGIAFVGEDGVSSLSGMSASVEAGVVVGGGVTIPGTSLGLVYMLNLANSALSGDVEVMLNSLQSLPPGSVLYVSNGVQAGAGIEVNYSWVDGTLNAQIHNPFTEIADANFNAALLYVENFWGRASLSWTFDYEGQTYGVRQTIEPVTETRDGGMLANQRTVIYGPDGDPISNSELAEFGFSHLTERVLIQDGGYVPHDNCFPAGTMIELLDGSTKPIEDIRVSDDVLSFDPKSGEMIPGKVVHLFNGVTDEWVKLEYVCDGIKKKLTATPNHRFLSPNGDFIPLCEMIEGNGEVQLTLASGETIFAKADFLRRDPDGSQAQHFNEKNTTPEQWKTYNFEVASSHTYVAEGVIVHNHCRMFIVSEGTLELLREADDFNETATVRENDDGTYLVVADPDRVVAVNDEVSYTFGDFVELAEQFVRHIGNSVQSVIEDTPHYLANAIPQLIIALMDPDQDFEDAIEVYGANVIANMSVDTLSRIFGLERLEELDFDFDEATQRFIIPDSELPRLFETEIGVAIKGTLVAAMVMHIVSGDDLTSEDYQRLATNHSVRFVVTQALQTQSWATIGGVTERFTDWFNFEEGAANLTPTAGTAAAFAVSLLVDLFDGGIEDPVAALGNAGIAAGSYYLTTQIVGTWTTTAATATTAATSGFTGGTLSQFLTQTFGSAAPIVGHVIGAIIGVLLGKIFGGLFAPPPPLVTVEENDDGSVTVYITSASGGYIYEAREGQNDVLIGNSGHDQLIGLDGDNKIHGLGGNDFIVGNAGNDLLTGGSGNDIINSGTGDDTSIGGTGGDTIDGGNGNDYLSGGDGNDLIYGDSILDEEETWHVANDNVAELGEDGEPESSGNTESSSNEEAELINSDQDATHNDIIVAGAGNDQVFAGQGDDFVLGSFGDDILLGQDGGDVIFGGDHNDYIDGGSGNDVLDGEIGHDRIIAGDGDDIIHGDKMVAVVDSDVSVAIKTWLDEVAAVDNDLKKALGVHSSYNSGSSLTFVPFWGAMSLGDALITKITTVQLALIEGLESQVSSSQGTPTDSEVIFSAFWNWLDENDANLRARIQSGDFEYLSSDYVAPVDDPETNEIDEAAAAPGQFLYTLGSTSIVADDTVEAGDGNDVAYGGYGDDDIYGGAGDDQLYGDGLRSTSDAEGETVIEFVGAGNDTLRGGLGNDTISAGDGNNLVQGGEGDDKITSGSGNDTIDAGLGADVIASGGGDDLIHAGDSGTPPAVGESSATEDALSELIGYQDIVTAGSGNDTVFGEAGVDLLYGGEGNDSLDGGSDDDSLYGEAGQDTLSGDIGDDSIVGGDGSDQIRGGAGADTIYGDTTEISLTVGGDDEIYGGEGDDVVSAGIGDDTVDGGAGNDALLGEFGADEIIGGAGDDTLVGGADGDSLYGGEGADQLDGGSGDDILRAGDGDDLVEGGSGADTLYGASGNDTLYGDQIEGTEGAADSINSGDGDDSIIAGDGGDTVHAGDGNDIIHGNAGDDLLTDGAGSDTLSGGSGADSFKITLNSSDHDVITDFEVGTDYLNLTEFGDLFREFAHIEALGTEITSSEAGTTLTFSNGQKLTLEGVAEAELSSINFLFNTDPSYSLTGTDGNDVLIGSSGFNILNGQAGNDRLQGGDGLDVFVIGQHAGDTDRISDFSIGQGADIIDVSAFMNVSSFHHFELSQVGADTMISFGDDQTLILESINVSDLTEDHFQFDRHGGTNGDDRLDLANGFNLRSDGNDIEQETRIFQPKVVGASEGLAERIEDRAGIDGALPTDHGTSEFGNIYGEYGISYSDAGGGDIVDIGSDYADSYDSSSNNNAYWDEGLCNDRLVMPVEFLGSFGDDLLRGSYWDEKIKALAGNDAILAGEGNDWVRAGAGNDIVAGDGGHDTIHGDEGDDYLMGGSGRDYLTGGDGNDTLRGDDGQDRILGGDGRDLIYGGNGNDVAYGNSGDDDLSGGAGNDLIDGGHGDDVANGGIGDDRIIGGLGHDLLLGSQGNDRITGDSGNDYLSGDSGHDNVSGGEGDDAVRGGTGHDLLSGGSGSDDVRGGDGNDTLWGGDDDDYLRGDEGNDSVNGGHGDDRLFGDQGNDILSGSHGNDLISGGDGNDQLLGNQGGDYLLGGDGRDRLYGGESGDRLEGNEGDDYLNGEDGSDTELGGQGNDTIIGGDGNDYLRGDEGDDRLLGDGDDDFIVGGDGQDSLYGGTGSDILYGGLGDDSLHGNIGNDSLSGGSGNDTILGGNGNDELHGSTGNDQISGNTGNDRILGGQGNDSLIGDEGNDFIDAGIGNDTLNGGVGVDLVDGGDGDDVLEGADDRDILLGGEGENFLNGGNGADFIAGGGHNDIIYGGGGSDLIGGFSGNDYIDGGSNGDVVDGGSGNDKILGGHGSDELYGGADHDILLGGTENDVVFGNTGNDEVYGNRGSDILHGGHGADLVNGGHGDDTITGGQGADLLFGGHGADVFNYDALNESTKTTTDVISDFDDQRDKIDLTDLDIAYENVEITVSDGYTQVAVEGTTFEIKLVGDDHELTDAHFQF